MLSKINKIKNLGLVFLDYAWNSHVSDGSLPNFKRYNLIYGWTGTGKTTLSKLLSSIESGSNPEMPDLEYEIEDNENNKFTQGQVFNKKVRVFNQAYVEDNIEIQKGKAKSITLVLGGVNKKIVEQIKNDQEKLEAKNKKLLETEKELKNYEKTQDKSFTEIAKTIYVAITGGAIRNYRRDHAKTDFTNLTTKNLLSDENLKKSSMVVKQKSQEKIDDFKKITITTKSGEEEIPNIIDNLLEETKKILSQKVESQTISRVKENSDISNWVETGIAIHSKHKSIKCEFCDQDLPKDRLLNLNKHFNEADKKLKENIDELLTKFSYINNLINDMVYPDKARLYDELQNDYEQACKKFATEKKIVLEAIKIVTDIIKQKKESTTEVVSLTAPIEGIKFNDSLKEIKKLVDKHNQKTDDFDTEKNNAVIELKNHYLSTIFDEIKDIDNKIEAEKDTIDKIKNGNLEKPDELGIKKLIENITKNQAKISSTHKACKDINKRLSTFLGRDELKFKPHKTKALDDKGKEIEIEDGYVIKRHGKLAHNLSDGEKTAIAFVYFTIHIKDKEFDLKKGLVVIDDPISSLDSNSQFQAFAFLKNSVKDAHQIFVLTHNFEFLKLLINWTRNINHGNDSKYYMIKNYYEENKRCAYLDKMDNELYEYETEYQYLFKILKEFESDGTIAQAYPIPNIARKVLDTFLMFRVPSGKKTYDKLEKIKESTNFDEDKIMAIYKFTNDQSHITGSGFDPSLVPETQKNVKYLLEMIEYIFPEHYEILQESITTS